MLSVDEAHALAREIGQRHDLFRIARFQVQALLATDQIDQLVLFGMQPAPVKVHRPRAEGAFRHMKARHITVSARRGGPLPAKKPPPYHSVRAPAKPARRSPRSTVDRALPARPGASFRESV